MPKIQLRLLSQADFAGPGGGGKREGYNYWVIGSYRPYDLKMGGGGLLGHTDLVNLKAGFTT